MDGVKTAKGAPAGAPPPDEEPPEAQTADVVAPAELDAPAGAGHDGGRPPLPPGPAGVEGLMKNAEVWRLLHALPGYAAMVGDAVQLLETEGPTLAIADISPDDLLTAREEKRFLAAREAILYAVYRSVHERRLRVDGRAMKMFEAIARRVHALEEDHHAVVERWRLLLDFLASLRGSGGAKREDPEPEPAGEPEEPIEA